MSATPAVNGSVKVASFPPSPDVVNAILKWSVEDRRDLALLLTDSIREGFASLAEAEESQKDLIQSRLDELVNGAELVETEEVFAEVRRRVAEVRKR